MIAFYHRTSKKMQLLDRGIFGSFKTNYKTKMKSENDEKPTRIYDAAVVVGNALPLVFSHSNITYGFQLSGLNPFNEDIIQEYEFLPSIVNDCLMREPTPKV